MGRDGVLARAPRRRPMVGTRAGDTLAAPADGARPSAGLGRLPGLDGLRAIAVLAVLAYHADLGLVPGGFLGVDVFFVISGYLITALLLAEWSTSGTIHVRAFWLRRARRLLPAVFLLLAAMTVFAVAVLPEEVARLRSDAAAAFGYVTNWYLILQHQSYFEAVGRPSPLRHLWSLAVEEQFYLAWPLVLLGGLLVLRRRLMLAATVVVAALSTAWMAALYVPGLDPSRVYYGTDTRLAPLLVGAALAFVWLPRRMSAGTPTTASLPEVGPASRRRLIALATDLGVILGLAGLAACFMLLDDGEPLLYTGGFAAVALITAVVIASVVHPASRIGRLVLDARALRWIGERSYSIYLWHWPVFVLTRPQLDVPLDAVADLAPRLLLTVLLADASYRFVETPVRQGALGRAWRAWRASGLRFLGPRQRVAATVLASLALVLAVGTTVEVVGAAPPPPPAYLAVPSLRGDLGGASPPAGAPLASASPTVAAPASGRPQASPAGKSIASRPGPSPRPAPSRPAASFAGASSRPSPVASARPSNPAPILAIGDSLLIGAAPALSRALGRIEIDAVTGRSFQTGVEILLQRQAAGTLPPTVIVDLGNNGRFYRSDFDRAMEALRGVRLVAFVNLKVPRDWESADNKTLAAGVAGYRKAILVDWHAASVNHPEFFWDDGIHVRPEGARVYAALVADVIRRAGAAR